MEEPAVGEPLVEASLAEELLDGVSGAAVVDGVLLDVYEAAQEMISGEAAFLGDGGQSEAAVGGEAGSGQPHEPAGAR